jgi:hypothetical protein
MRWSREEAAPVKAVEACGDGVAGVEERDAGVEVGGDGIALAGAGESPCPSASVSARRSSTHTGGASEDADRDSKPWGPGGADNAVDCDSVRCAEEKREDAKIADNAIFLEYSWRLARRQADGHYTSRLVAVATIGEWSDDQDFFLPTWTHMEAAILPTLIIRKILIIYIYYLQLPLKHSIIYLSPIVFSIFHHLYINTDIRDIFYF